MNVIESVARIFDDAGVAYVIIGGHAVNAWLEPRFTADIDVTVHTEPAQLGDLKRAMSAAGLLLTTEHGGEQASGPDFIRFTSYHEPLIVEVQTAKTDLQREVVRRAIAVNQQVRVATVEDLIVLKLIAHRPKDRADLVGLAALPSVDWSYVESWAREWEIIPRLEALRRGT